MSNSDAAHGVRPLAATTAGGFALPAVVSLLFFVFTIEWHELGHYLAWWWRDAPPAFLVVRVKPFWDLHGLGWPPGFTDLDYAIALAAGPFSQSALSLAILITLRLRRRTTSALIPASAVGVGFAGFVTLFGINERHDIPKISQLLPSYPTLALTAPFAIVTIAPAIFGLRRLRKVRTWPDTIGFAVTVVTSVVVTFLVMTAIGNAIQRSVA